MVASRANIRRPLRGLATCPAVFRKEAISVDEERFRNAPSPWSVFVTSLFFIIFSCHRPPGLHARRPGYSRSQFDTNFMDDDLTVYSYD